MSDEDEGLPLGEAIRAYGDPELWAAYESARAKVRSLPLRPRWIDSSRREREAWLDRCEAAERAARAAVGKAWSALVRDFKQRLGSIEMEVTGIETPLTRTSKRTGIPAPLRSVLLLDFKDSSAKYDTLKFIDVRIRMRSLEASSKGQGAIDGPGFVGRPSLMRAVEQEMRRRAERGELCPKLAEECRVHAAWAREAFPGHQTPTAKAIENVLRSVYWQLKPLRNALKSNTCREFPGSISGELPGLVGDLVHAPS